MLRVRLTLFGICFFLLSWLSGTSHAAHSFLPAAGESLTEYDELRQDHKLKLSFLKVGQGDAAILILPNGKTVLIDGGPPEAGEVILHKLIEAGIQKLDLVVSTHPDVDHIGGLITVIQQVPVMAVLDSGKPYYSLTYKLYRRSIRKRRLPFEYAKEGVYLPLDPDVSIQVMNNGKKKLENNESSIVLKIRYQRADFLLTGDADVKTEREMIEKYDMHADVLKVGHHGSYTSTSRAFLRQVNPLFAVISYERGNPYGHPHRSVLRRLKRFGIQMYRTADGDVEFETDGRSISVNGDMPLPLVR
nr:ComEC/Rec2 family competence protein [Ectobacillus ponti]